jgi:hypothetical protein
VRSLFVGAPFVNWLVASLLSLFLQRRRGGRQVVGPVPISSVRRIRWRPRIVENGELRKQIVPGAEGFEGRHGGG